MKWHPVRRSTRALAFAVAARAYWLGIWPSLSLELRRWRNEAEHIPERLLRVIALKALEDKRGNLEGAAAFATLSARSWRKESTCAMALYQAIFDYLDYLCEQPNPDPIANGRQLNQALLLAVRPGTEHADYYALHANHHGDGGYLAMLVDQCRQTLARLPSYTSVSAAIDRATRRVATYQSLNHGDATGSHKAFAHWSASQAIRHQRERGEILNWWEIGASCGSSLGIFALIAAATRSTVSAQEIAAIEWAYFPWIGATNSFLDSLIDQHEDTAPGQHLLLNYYTSPEHATERLWFISREAARRADELPPRYGHTLILAGMIGFYLSNVQQDNPSSRAIGQSALSNVKDFAAPALIVMRSRHAATSIKHRLAIFLGTHRQI